MILITGGLGSGRHTYARRAFFGKEILEFGPVQAQGILRAGGDIIREAVQLAAAHPEAVMITQEVGCGIVPAEASDRAWREALGHAACRLAEKSDTVILMNCGIAQVIKGRRRE